MFQRVALFFIAGSILAACDGDSSSVPAPTLDLRITVSHQAVRYDWDPVAKGGLSSTGVFYGNQGDYLEFSTDNGRTSTSSVMAPPPLDAVVNTWLADWARAMYRIQSCGNEGCAYSAWTPMAPKLPDAVTLVHAEVPRRDAMFGRQLALNGAMVLAVGLPDADSRTPGTPDDCGSATPVNCLPDSGEVAIYRRTGKTWAYVETLKASNAAAGDRFGDALAFSSHTLAVGAPGEDGPDTGMSANAPADACDAASPTCAGDSGAVYLFNPDVVGGPYRQTHYVKPAFTRAGDRYGEEIAASNTFIVIAAPGDDSAGSGIDDDSASDCGTPLPLHCATDSGAVHLLDKTAGGAWRAAHYIKPPADLGVIRGFGARLAASLQGFRFSVASTGATDDTGAVDTYEYLSGDDGIRTWQHRDDRLQADGEGSMELVPALTGSGNTLAVGVPGAAGTGIVLLYDLAISPMTTLPSVRPADDAQQRAFGRSLAITDNGYLAVGAWLDASAASGIRREPGTPCNPVTRRECSPGSGAVFGYRREGNAWLPASFLKPLFNEPYSGTDDFPDAPTTAGFGYSLALSWDAGTLIVSAPWQDGDHAGVGNGWHSPERDGCVSGDRANCLPNAGAIHIY